jgi:hypothetical protein
MARHRGILRRWLAAGRCMGLCDASAFPPVPGEIETDHVLVWVRENPSPAYMIAPEGMHWRVTDCVRGHSLACHPSFEAALHSIRPVLKPDATCLTARDG